MEKKRWMTNIKNAIEGKSKRTVKGQPTQPKTENAPPPVMQRKDSVVQPVTGEFLYEEKSTYIQRISEKAFHLQLQLPFKVQHRLLNLLLLLLPKIKNFIFLMLQTLEMFPLLHFLSLRILPQLLQHLLHSLIILYHHTLLRNKEVTRIFQ